MNTGQWSHDEDMLLRLNYREHGASWCMWESLLPGRTDNSIRNRARRLGLAGGGEPEVRFKADANVERTVVRMFNDGMACSTIDLEMRMPEGRAHDIIVGYWAEEKDRMLRPR